MNNIIDLEPACKRSPSLNEKHALYRLVLATWRMFSVLYWMQQAWGTMKCISYCHHWEKKFSTSNERCHATKAASLSTAAKHTGYLQHAAAEPLATCISSIAMTDEPRSELTGHFQFKYERTLLRAWLSWKSQDFDSIPLLYLLFYAIKIDDVSLKMKLLHSKLTLQRLVYRCLLTAITANARNNFQ